MFIYCAGQQMLKYVYWITKQTHSVTNIVWFMNKLLVTQFL